MSSICQKIWKWNRIGTFYCFMKFKKEIKTNFTENCFIFLKIRVITKSLANKVYGD